MQCGWTHESSKETAVSALKANQSHMAMERKESIRRTMKKRTRTCLLPSILDTLKWSSKWTCHLHWTKRNAYHEGQLCSCTKKIRKKGRTARVSTFASGEYRLATINWLRGDFQRVNTNFPEGHSLDCCGGSAQKHGHKFLHFSISMNHTTFHHPLYHEDAYDRKKNHLGEGHRQHCRNRQTRNGPRDLQTSKRST